MAITIYYYIKDNKIYDMSYVLDKSLDDFYYGLYPRNDYIFANHNGNKINKDQVIMDLQKIVKNKSKYQVNSFDKLFIQLLKALGITREELINKVIKYKEPCRALTSENESEFWKQYKENMEAINGRSIDKSRNNPKVFTYTVK